MLILEFCFCKIKLDLLSLNLITLLNENSFVFINCDILASLVCSDEHDQVILSFVYENIIHDFSVWT